MTRDELIDGIREAFREGKTSEVVGPQSADADEPIETK
jgi:hypothetical protein